MLVAISFLLGIFFLILDYNFMGKENITKRQTCQAIIQNLKNDSGMRLMICAPTSGWIIAYPFRLWQGNTAQTGSYPLRMHRRSDHYSSA
jgi:hypothetical protein